MTTLNPFTGKPLAENSWRKLEEQGQPRYYANRNDNCEVMVQDSSNGKYLCDCSLGFGGYMVFKKTGLSMAVHLLKHKVYGHKVPLSVFMRLLKW